MKLPKEQREQAVAKIQQYFYEERSEEIGELAAGLVFDFVMKEIGPYFYNKGVKDARDMLEQKIMNLDEDLASLERPLDMFRRR
ncbi:DUF2164 domain-containing protein [Pseudalkalibacillus caeni]|uniref:DUF2164 domain-containing protein n=2 Tax=Exobacillus caeni TaxID=2574798 RepID=A0A5R9F336_9BACL|nr:DUF2164 domain-containing protein [Pseudalkalibacillus caeni]